MDPNVALANLREAVANLSIDGEGVEEVIENFTALDEWLSKDGFLPDDWQSDDEKAART